jgi:hypothetical protein
VKGLSTCVLAICIRCIGLSSLQRFVEVRVCGLILFGRLYLLGSWNHGRLVGLRGIVDIVALLPLWCSGLCGGAGFVVVFPFVAVWS